MTIDEVRRRVEDIRAVKDDDETAHSMEDDLYEDILRSIAAGTCDDPAGVCEAALHTQEIEFARWCA